MISLQSAIHIGSATHTGALLKRVPVLCLQTWQSQQSQFTNVELTVHCSPLDLPNGQSHYRHRYDDIVRQGQMSLH